MHLKFSEGKQKEFLLKVKKNLDCSWDKLAEKIGVHRQTIFVYLKETTLISEENFKKLCKLSRLNEEDFVFEKISIKNRIQEIECPKLSNNLSEFLGMLAGDGYVADKKPYEISIVAHRVLDKNIIEENAYNLIKGLFGLAPKISYQGNAVRVRIYSKQLKEFLVNYDVPSGKKKGNLKIPSEILKNKEYLRCYLRGLFDTDGSFHRHHKNTGCVEFISRDEIFLKDVKNALALLNFKTSISRKNLYIYNQKEIKRFFSEIGTNNLKNKIKYESFIKGFGVPLTKEIMLKMR